MAKQDEVRPATEAPDPNEQVYYPAPGELQLTVRAVVIGAALGSVITVINIYFGLKTGWTIGGSLIAAILSFALFQVLRPKQAFTVLETNIAQTTASAAGSMATTAGLIAPLPAIALLGHKLEWWQLMLWAASVAWLGVFFAVPLRRQMILVDKLRFPTGTATAHTINAMFASGAETLRKARTLILWAGFTAIIVLIQYFFPQAQQPPLETWLGGGALATAAAYTFTLYLDPMLIGAGILVGMRVSVSLVAGAIVAWGVLAPLVEGAGWVDDPAAHRSFQSGAAGWILWTGVAIMIADAMTNLALSWRSILNTFRRKPVENGQPLEDPEKRIPSSWWMGGLAISTVVTATAVYLIFDIPPWMTVIAILLSSVLAAIATRSAGETDINPISGVGKVTQLAYAGLAPNQPVTNLLAAAVTGAGATQAGDMMQDLKTGHLLGAWPRKQFIAQLVGIAAGVVFCVPIFLLLTAGHEIGAPEGKFPAPAAHAWKSMALVLSEGLDTLPKNAGWGALAGLLFGILVPMLRRFVPKLAPYLPSALAFGIAFIIPAYYSIPFLIGAVAHLLWKRARPEQAESLSFSVASGIMVGAGLCLAFTQLLQFLGLDPLT